MPVDFLDIAPKEVAKTKVAIHDKDGQEHEVEIQPIDNTDIAKLANRFPMLRKTLFLKDVPEDVSGVALMEAWPAIVAAGLGHIGDERYEAAARRFDQTEIQKLGKVILEISFPRPETSDPLPASAAAVIAEAQQETNSPPPSNS